MEYLHAYTRNTQQFINSLYNPRFPIQINMFNQREII